MLLLLFTFIVLQIFLLPGLVVLGRLRSLHYIDRLLLAVPVSFLINYLIVLVLVLTESYTQFAMLCILAVEAATLLMIHRDTWQKLLDWRFPGRIALTIDAFTLESAIKLVSFGSVFYLFTLCAGQVGSVISDWDGVASWGRWAISWYNGTFPETVWSYPQVLPVLYSIAYKFVNSPIIYVAPKLIPIMICAVIPITAIRLAYLLRDKVFLEVLLAIPVFIYLARNLVYPDYVFSGSADMASAYFGLVCIYCITLSKTSYGRASSAEYHQIMFWLAVATATSFIVKQAAIFASAFFSVGWYWVTRKLPMPNRPKILLGIWLIAALIPLHWYLYIFLNSPNPVGTVSIYEPFLKAAWYLRPYEGAKMIIAQVGWWPAAFFVMGAWIRPFRVLLVPFTTIYLAWAFIVSYDPRNLYVALPLIAFLIAAGIISTIKLAIQGLSVKIGGKPLSSYISGRTCGLTMLAVLLLATYSLSTRDYYPRIIDKSFREQMKIGSERMNYFLYDGFREKYTGTGVLIASDYQMMKFVPKLDEFFYHAHCTSAKDFSVAFMNKNTRFILTTNNCVKDVVSYLDEGLTNGKFRLVYESNDHRLLEIADPGKRCLEYLKLNPESSWGGCQ